MKLVDILGDRIALADNFHLEFSEMVSYIANGEVVGIEMSGYYSNT